MFDMKKPNIISKESSKALASAPAYFLCEVSHLGFFSRWLFSYVSHTGLMPGMGMDGRLLPVQSRFTAWCVSVYAGHCLIFFFFILTVFFFFFFFQPRPRQLGHRELSNHQICSCWTTMISMIWASHVSFHSFNITASISAVILGTYPDPVVQVIIGMGACFKSVIPSVASHHRRWWRICLWSPLSQPSFLPSYSFSETGRKT